MPDMLTRRSLASSDTAKVTVVRLASTSTREVAQAVAVAALAGGSAGGLSATLGEGVPGVTAGVVAAEAIPLVWRRRAPFIVLVLTLLVGGVAALLPAVAFSPLVAALVATYTVAAHRPWPAAAAAAGVAGLVSPLVLRGLLDAEYPFHVTVVPADHLANYVAGSLLVFGCVAGLGMLAGAWRARTARLTEYAARLERERVERERRAVLEERARIARELHDVAAHHLSGLVLQAGALERTAAHDPERARQLAGEVRQGGATALASMRRLVGLLRAADEEPARGSQPSLVDLDGLIEAARRDGLDVDLVADAATEECAVPGEVGLACYRIVQEALSNTRRHAPGAHAEVRLRPDNGRLTVEVSDDGGDVPPLPSAGDELGQGHGLIGMRERVTLLDGHLEAGPRQPSGWRVHATLPIELDDEEST